jgi:hypothetical protein
MPCDLHSRSPTVTARAHRGPAVSDAVRTGQGPGSRAWKARPGTPLSRDATPMAQVKALLERPLLSVGDREGPLLRARGGHGRRGSRWLGSGSGGHKLYRRVRPVRDDHLPRWQVAGGARQWNSGGLPSRYHPGRGASSGGSAHSWPPTASGWRSSPSSPARCLLAATRWVSDSATGSWRRCGSESCVLEDD